MKPELPIQFIDADSGDQFEELHLDWPPHPGSSVEIGDQIYTILEKRHSYHLRDGRYCLHAIRAYVRPAPSLDHLEHPFVIGDPSCLHNAHSPLLRCAVNPRGPCQGCVHYQRGDIPGGSNL